MRVGLKKRTSGGIEFGIIYGGIGLLMLAAARFPPIVALAPHCAFKSLIGFPCPACGSTRSIVHLAHADLFSAFAMNPLTCVVFLAAFPAFFYSVIALVFRLPRINVSFSRKEKDALRILGVMAVLSNWLYLIFAL